ncbi:MAG: Outer rane lipoprotein Omp16, partial [Bacteroidetes bacterium]|nr:Outer rane lipoprotein Omp16 [Bacteroidota bacterium]
KVRSYTWSINNTPIMQTASQFDHKFDAAGTYTIAAKIVVYCDTCTSLISLCNEKVVTVGDQLTKVDSLSSKNNTLVKNEKNSKPDKKSKKEKVKETVVKNEESENKNESIGKNNSSFLNDDELKALNWNTSPALFNSNESALRSDASAILDNNVNILKNNENLGIVINGYADSKGAAAYNKNLSAKRAQAVKQYMVEHGVPAKRILSTHGYGEENPVNKCKDGVECSDEEYQANRRVEFQVKAKRIKS